MAKICDEDCALFPAAMGQHERGPSGLNRAASKLLGLQAYFTAGAEKAGKMRAEGKEYVVKDGDVLNFLFNV